ncbi:hypothetical protein [Runella sp.]|uniref:hypothetical protein n=1 Tax=Runella sp. TaxID=1960881 RepID=UPI003D0B3D0C
MIEYQNNGRALQLEGLENARNKVTLGFKYDGGTKIQLAHEANQNGMTLSEYVETVISLRHQKAASAPGTKSRYTFSEWESKLSNARKLAEVLQKRLDFYEINPILNHLFLVYEGQSIPYADAQGRKQLIEITQPADVFTVLIHSFKL